MSRGAEMRAKIAERLCLTAVVCTLLNGVAGADQAVRIYSDGHDVQLELGQSDTFSVYISAPLPNSTTVQFYLSDGGVLEPIPSLSLPAGTNETQEVNMSPKARGHCTISANSSRPETEVSISDLYVRVNVLKSFGLNVFSAVVGWIYFVAWTVSFYPQIYINFRRKSVVGLNFDFLALNLMGFTFYSVFNCGLYFSQTIQDMYFNDHPYGLVPVAVNDIVFALHAAFACIVTILQCLIYDRGEQRVSWTARGLLVAFMIVIIVTCIVAAAGSFNWLWFLYVFSYVKLAITIIKYVPQAYMNFRRKSTEGWSIGNVLLDCTGGTLSILQMFIDAYNFNDWSSIFGNPTKFGLGLFSVLFDCLFIIQHYCLYRKSPSKMEFMSQSRMALDTELEGSYKQGPTRY